MLCTLCQSLFYMHLMLRDSTTNEVYHDYHQNLMSLSTSAKTGCHFCVKLLGALKPVDRYDAYPRLRDPTGDLVLDRYSITVTFSTDFRKYPTGDLEFIFEYPNPLDNSSQKSVLVICAIKLEQDAKRFVVEEEVSSRTDSQHTFTQVFRWLTNCNKNHTTCCPPPFHAQNWRPTRLLYIKPTEESFTLCLHEGDQIPQGVTYMTLSHCWGLLPMITLTKASLLEMKHSIPWTSLTKTFQDAIEITQNLRISYLWIDSLCIIQDSPTDWDQESAIMGEIYRYSYCNIAATSAADGRSGFLVKRDPLLIEACKVRAKWADGTWANLTCLFPDFLSTGFDSEPLNQRAWVVQERLLPPRVLHFCTTGLIWECNELTASETAPLGFAHMPISMRGTLKTRRRFSELAGTIDESALRILHRAWGNIVTVYSKCALTKETDKLVALSGLSNEIQGLLQDEYLAGLFRRNLECQLLWEVKGSYHARRPSIYVAPSWSWASLCDASVFPDSWIQTPSQYQSLISIDKAWVTCDDGVKSQKIKSGTIILRGQIVPGFDHYSLQMLDEHSEWESPLISNDDISPDIRDVIHERVDMDYLVPGWPLLVNPNDLWYLPVKLDCEGVSPLGYPVRGISQPHKELSGLVLRRISPERNEFLRLGIFRIKLEKDIHCFWRSCGKWEAASISNADIRALNPKPYNGIVQYDPLLRVYRIANNVRQYTIALI